MIEARITSPDGPALDRLCGRLAELAPALDRPGVWPAEQLRLCGEAGVFEWFIADDLGGQGWSEADVLRGYVKLAAACLTTTFVITQRTGAMSRIAAAIASGQDPGRENETLDRLLADLIAGRTFATVGISHLTTSRQHLARPVLRAQERDGGFALEGYSPWVTGAEHAQHIVLGATLDDGRQILAAMPTYLPGVRIEPAPELVGLSASRTGPVYCDDVFAEQRWVLAGPVAEVMKQGVGAKTGGLQTSALAIGLASAAIRFLNTQAEARANLIEPVEALEDESERLVAALLTISGGSLPGNGDNVTGGLTPSTRQDDSGRGECITSGNELRQRANSLALRASQAALAAAKGAGYVAGHPTGRWCREALFFLVWSCPAPVLQANLCELAGITE